MSWRGPLLLAIVISLAVSANGVGADDADAGMTCNEPGIPEPLPDDSGLAVGALSPGMVHHWLVTTEGDSTHAYFDGTAIGGEANVRLADPRPDGAMSCRDTCTSHDGEWPVPRPADRLVGGCGGKEAQRWIFTIAVSELAPGADSIHYEVQLSACSYYLGPFYGDTNCLPL